VILHNIHYIELLSFQLFKYATMCRDAISILNLIIIIIIALHLRRRNHKRLYLVTPVRIKSVHRFFYEVITFNNRCTSIIIYSVVKILADINV